MAAAVTTYYNGGFNWASVSVALVEGILGGGTYGEFANGSDNYCIDGVRCASSSSSKVTVNAIAGGLSGSLLVG